MLFLLFQWSKDNKIRIVVVYGTIGMFWGILSYFLSFTAFERKELGLTTSLRHFEIWHPCGEHTK